MTLSFLIPSVTFIIVVGMLGSLLGMTLISGSVSKITPPTCDISGADALIDAIICFGKMIGYFFNLMTVSSEFFILGTILLILSIGLGYVVIRLLRGGG